MCVRACVQVALVVEKLTILLLHIKLSKGRLGIWIESNNLPSSYFPTMWYFKRIKV